VGVKDADVFAYWKDEGERADWADEDRPTF
jgi:hypothetical protein